MKFYSDSKRTNRNSTYFWFRFPFLEVPTEMDASWNQNTGGGFPNGIASLSDARFLSFRFYYFDDGEVPLEELITNIEDPNYNSYKNFLLEDGTVVYKNIPQKQDYK
jgi:hypothetical protein